MFLLVLAISVKRGLGEFYILKQRNVFEGYVGIRRYLDGK